VVDFRREILSILPKRYYSAKTLHMHKVTANQWNSLGPMYPYYKAAEPQRSPSQRQPTTYFMYEGVKPAHEQTKQHSILENPCGNTGYINGETLSMLSSISPAVYLARLIVVCLLSLVYFDFAMLLTVLNAAANAKETRMLAATLCHGLCLFHCLLGPGQREVLFGDPIILASRSSTRFRHRSPLSRTALSSY
jgi:hypothetical protein